MVVFQLISSSLFISFIQQNPIIKVSICRNFNFFITKASGFIEFMDSIAKKNLSGALNGAFLCGDFIMRQYVTTVDVPMMYQNSCTHIFRFYKKKIHLNKLSEIRCSYQNCLRLVEYNDRLRHFEYINLFQTTIKMLKINCFLRDSIQQRNVITH